jgi:hypothetical protein
MKMTEINLTLLCEDWLTSRPVRGHSAGHVSRHILSCNIDYKGEKALADICASLMKYCAMKTYGGVDVVSLQIVLHEIQCSLGLSHIDRHIRSKILG